MSTSKCYSYIRFSTPEQIKGDSLRRQLEMSENYAREKGYVFDKEITFKDLGLSAFSGEHRKKGSLRCFLELVENGKIRKGSILIVESLDRLSREMVLDALEQFTNIIRKGIKIVTLTDGMEYTEEIIKNNPTQLMLSIMIMSRSHEESLIKSKRLKEAWDNKRHNLDTRKLTSMCPAWMTLNEDKTEFILNDERASLICEIFQMSKSGYGMNRIAKKLNEKGVKSWKNDKGWRASYIHKILKNKSVIGEFQPHKKIDGKRIPEGDPVSNYFPRVIEDDLFYQVQSRLREHASYGGKTGNIRNLFGGLAKCGYCGSPMQFVNKGSGKKGTVSLVCDSARRGLGCEYHSYEYNELEEAILTFCKEIDLKKIISVEQDQSADIAEKVKQRIESNVERLKNLNLKSANLLDALSEKIELNVKLKIIDKMNEIENEIDNLKKEKLSAEMELKEMFSVEDNYKFNIDSVNYFYSKMKDLPQDQKIDLRLKIRNSLRNVLSEIILYPVGTKNYHGILDCYISQKIMEEKENTKYTDEDLIKKIKERFGIGRDSAELIRERLHNFFGYKKNDRRLRRVILKFKNKKSIGLVPKFSYRGSKYYIRYKKEESEIYFFDSKERIVNYNKK